MKKIFFLLLLAVIIIQPALSQEYFNKKENQHRKHLVLVHPTRSNLERYSYLLDQGILDPGKLKIVGLYFEAENYDYSEVIRDFPQFGYHMIPGKIEIEEIYRENSASTEFRKIFDNSRGIIFNGGPDIPPAAYGEEMSTLTIVTDPYRHFYELSFLFHLLGGYQDEDFKPFLHKRPRYMIFGICLGMQSMNVAAGGTLVQDIPSEIYAINSIEDILALEKDKQHRNYYTNYKLFEQIPSYFLHPIKPIPGRWIDSEIKYNGASQPLVFSSHHQAVDILGKDFRVAATSVDKKIIEAIEHTRYPNVFGIQFHPEVQDLYKEEKTARFEPGENLFSLKEELIKTQSLDFHIGLWKLISNAL